uniref:Uncharacterized protein n=1 Tax=Cyprinus carpio TaxID=7962 RepID=A0A8C1Y845_CYPCA
MPIECPHKTWKPNMWCVCVFVLLNITVESFSTYDPQYCYILDGILLLYCILITAFFVRERYIKKKSKVEQDSLYQVRIRYVINEPTIMILKMLTKGLMFSSQLTRAASQTYLISQLNIGSLSNKSHFIWFDVFNVFVFQGLSSMTKDTYDSLNMQPIHPPPR